MSLARAHPLLALLAALALTTAACGGGDSGKGAAGEGGAGSSSTTSASGDGASDGSTDGSDDGPSGSDPATADISSQDTVPLQLKDLEPNEYGAPLPGSYLYDVVGADAPVELSVRDLLDDQDADSFDRTRYLRQLHHEKEGSEARANLVKWTSSGLFLDAEQRAQNTTGGLQEGPVCDYEPDLLLQPRDLTVGATWDDESTCLAAQGEVTLTRERTLSGEVVGASTAQVEGQTFETLRIKRVTDTTTTADTEPPLLLTEHREVTIEWIVGSGLAARIDGTVIETVSGVPSQRLYTWTLRSTTPVQ